MSTLQLPPECKKMRDFLFEMPVPFSMYADVFELYWSLLDNVWSRYDEFNVVGKVDKVQYDSIRFVCRFARKIEEEPTRSGASGKRKRREGGTCSCRVKAKKFHGIPGIPDHYRFEHSSAKEADWVHSHNLDESDAIKINSFLKAAAALEAAKGFMPAEVYKTLRNVKILDLNGYPVGDALDVCGGKFMTRLHANNAKQSALSVSGGKFLAGQQTVEKRKQTSPRNQVSFVTPTSPTDMRTVWPPNLGTISDDHYEHAKNIKNDIRSLVDSIAIGKRTDIPRDVLLPMLNSVADYMDKDIADLEGRSVLDIILKTQRTAGILPKHSPQPRPTAMQTHMPAQPTPMPANNAYNTWYGYN